MIVPFKTLPALEELVTVVPEPGVKLPVSHLPDGRDKVHRRRAHWVREVVLRVGILGHVSTIVPPLPIAMSIGVTVMAALDCPAGIVTMPGR